MSVLEMSANGGMPMFDLDQCLAAGTARASAYQQASPFPHIVMDEFLDRAMLRALASEFPERSSNSMAFDRDQERFKYQFQPSKAGPGLQYLLSQLNSGAFLAFLEAMTGIRGLIPDPYFEGGGLHETLSGGHLSVHADFNIHSKMKVERRLNLLIYLNDDWPADYGGNLELWDRRMTRREVEVPPLLGRAVLFNTTLESFHGQPDPVRCPENRSRRSIATYYYTAFEHGLEQVPKRTTTFQVRPGTGDKADLRIKLDHWMEDWVPPRLLWRARKLNPFK
jgi:Rps23 Pro-64 3,4-dihydroxylase Tpa1-like proline 4-hydroxylase